MSLDQINWDVISRSGGKNKIILDNVNMPSEMVWIPKFNLNEVMAGAPATPHPAFIINGETINGFWIGKYQSVFKTTSGLTRAYSLAGQNPAVSHTFDTARTNARNKGTGWHLQTNAEWAAVALLSKALGKQPTGNNNYGKDYYNALETGRQGPGRETDGRYQAWLTGSGSDATYHDGSRATGIADLNGNVREWCGGWRLNEGENQVIPDNDAALDDADLQSAASAAWRAIDVDGDYVAVGGTKTWKWDYNSANPTASGNANFKLRLGAIVNKQTSDTGNGQAKYGSLTVAADATTGAVPTVPWKFKALGIYPDGVLADYATPGTTQGRGDFYFRNNGERLPYRGGYWGDGASAGLFCTCLNGARSYSNSYLGSRLAFVEL